MNQATLFGHPKGLFLVSGTELWERFSYYGMLGLLVLFLTADSGIGGFAWSSAAALKLLGFYSGLIFAVPAIGGWVTSRWLGERRAILYGGLLVALGHVLLGGPVYLLGIAGAISGLDIGSALNAPGLRFDRLFPDDEFLTSVVAAYPGVSDPGGFLAWLRLGYVLKLWSFLLGLVLIVIGTGLIKPSVSSIVDRLYDKDDSRRQSGFTIFMVSIYVGSFTANFVAGTMGEKIGWHVGFSAAAIGMLIGIAAYVIGQKKYLGNVGMIPQAREFAHLKSTHHALDRKERRRIALLLIMGAHTVLYALAFYQKGGLLNLYAKENVDRVVLGFEIPATWLLTISTGIFIFFAPATIRWLGRRVPNANAIAKLAMGLILIGSAYLLLAAAETLRLAAAGGESPVVWLAMTYVLFGVADILVWPAQISAAAALAPRQFVSFSVGAWYLTIGIGATLTGYVGALSSGFGHLAVFVGLAAVCSLAGVLLIVFRPALQRLAHGATL